ncbi:SDR family oxidoreductase [Roseisolibacter sp. H3M3-2]|uniref:SDR family NAD(P)-dependent oxidoreductase n=1 Tax=Roseisolibacter sp. H3M3-2 TaxID=3031323 RepID=UPI0023D98C18|nr:SDR family oxidoreductase [Roseisolibacter sp. H3M3-2]MDF1503649.1 SDR family NAD(P)-dependent oxidoreductase [Roseisolibacter sp. H3M3-2]
MPHPILITGVGREGQVGEAVARALAATGAPLALVDRTPEHVEARAAALRAEGRDAHAFACDLTVDEEVEATVARVREAVGDVGALVCVAGGFQPGTVAESDSDVWGRMLSRNGKTAMLVTRAALPMLRRTRGSVVYFGSVAALPGATGAGMAAYAAAKGVVLALMRAVAEEERAHGVRANAVAPTSIRTADNVAAMGDRGDYVSREDVAAAVAWLCSDAARGVTGQVVRLG